MEPRFCHMRGYALPGEIWLISLADRLQAPIKLMLQVRRIAPDIYNDSNCALSLQASIATYSRHFSPHMPT
jgi:hypothetical protein